MTLRAFIFDVDGTLAETQDAHRAAFNATFAAHRLNWFWSRDDYARLLKTTGGKERMTAYCAEIGVDTLPDIAALHADKTRRYTAMFAEGRIKLRPGVGALMARAKAAGLRLAIATTTSGPNVEALARCVWGRPATDLFDVIAAGDEVAAKKPAPDVYLLALARLGLPASNAIALEDSRNGLISARAAGLRCVVTPSAYTADEDFNGADWVVPSLDDAHLPDVLQSELA